ncbi:MAG: hypothetical protein GX131_15090 [candidate division WS1 bacterium]|nr:hypothetical protein [candidate division WS1 bacterium]
MADLQQQMQPDKSRFIRRRRVSIIVALGLAAIIWGPRATLVLVEGWNSSLQVMEHQRRIEAADGRLAALEREVAYSATAEGRDVEAKRRFGVGPRDEILITVEVEAAPPPRPVPQSIAERVDVWLGNVGSGFIDRGRQTAAVFRYWFGMDEIEQPLPVRIIDETEGLTDPGRDPADAEAPDPVADAPG